jgi:putative polyketide hydroxylase
MARHVPVLIVGAGFAGLTTALMLKLRGVSCLVVERREALSRHPRAHGVNLRSLELLRQVPGLEADLHGASRASSDDNTVIIAETVSGPIIKTLASPGNHGAEALSPAAICSAGQDRVEPLLLRHARERGAEICFSTWLESFTQDTDGVRAVLRDAESGEVSVILADYLVAADGSGSGVRKALGVAMHGHASISHAVSILFEADLAAALAGRGFLLCYIHNPAFRGAFVSCDDANRGQLNVEYDPARQSVEEFDVERCIEFVRIGLGQPDLDVRILDIIPWRMSALLVDCMNVGRVFLAGDAAHIMPPVGGLAGQAAIQDAADIAWKLAMVIQSHAGQRLLSTYDSERRPVAQLAIARAMTNYVERLREDRVCLADDLGRVPYRDVALSYRYRSPAISLDTPDDGRTVDDSLRPSGKPGSRLAHIRLRRDGAIVSILDLVGNGFVLLAGPAGTAWVEAASKLAQASGVPLTAFRIGTDFVDIDESFLTRTGLERGGAVLVRPDGFVAWRFVSEHADPDMILSKAITRALCRAPDR